MENKEIVRKLNKLKGDYIKINDISQGVNQTELASNYQELISLIAELLQTSVSTLDELPESPEIQVSELKFTVSEVIVMAIKLLPLSEMKFIDETLQLLDNKNSTFKK